ncbi:MAG: amidase, partial [Mesorhizobium sp.]|nr:amidase [Mesorhizobium sp.]
PPAPAAAALDRLAGIGAEVRQIQVPLHARGIDIWMPVILYGTLAGLWTDGVGAGLTRDEMATMGQHLSGWQARGSELSDVLRVLLLAAEVARRKHGFTPYFQGHAEGRALRAAYDAALEEVDVLAMPTVAGLAGRLPDPEASLQARFDAAVETTGNTAPFNLTGHPAITVPCGLADGLPVGLMFVARHGDEAALFRAAAAVEAVTQMPAPPSWG